MLVRSTAPTCIIALAGLRQKTQKSAAHPKPKPANCRPRGEAVLGLGGSRGFPKPRSTRNRALPKKTYCELDAEPTKH